jgi:putative ABC transport system permease protein
VQVTLGGSRYEEDAAVLAFQDVLLERVRALPGVSGAALAGQVPLGGNGDSWGFHVQGRMRANTSEDPSVERYAVTPDYFRLLGIELVRGRLFGPADRAHSEPVLLVSAATAAQVWGGADPIGSLVRVGGADEGPWRRVVGVVGDVHHQDLAGPPTLAFYTPQSQNTDSYLVLVTKTRKDPAALERSLVAAVREIDPHVPVDAAATMGELVERAVAQRRFVARLLGGFAAVALLLAAVGLYGVVAYGVAQRTREVGVRVALGARPGDVLALVVGRGVPLVLLGLAAGLVVAAATTRFLGGLVVGVSRTDPWSFAAAAGILAVVALLAHWVPIRRALAVEPVAALRLD